MREKHVYCVLHGVGGALAVHTNHTWEAHSAGSKNRRLTHVQCIAQSKLQVHSACI